VPPEDLEIDAITQVRAWPTSDPTRNVGQVLDERAARSGRLSPWTAEKLDDAYKVTFIVAPVSRKAVVYEFETRLSDKNVMGSNPAAQDLLP